TIKMGKAKQKTSREKLSSEKRKERSSSLKPASNAEPTKNPEAKEATRISRYQFPTKNPMPEEVNLSTGEREVIQKQRKPPTEKPPPSERQEDTTKATQFLNTDEPESKLDTIEEGKKQIEEQLRVKKSSKENVLQGASAFVEADLNMTKQLKEEFDEAHYEKKENAIKLASEEGLTDKKAEKDFSSSRKEERNKGKSLSEKNKKKIEKPESFRKEATTRITRHLTAEHGEEASEEKNASRLQHQEKPLNKQNTQSKPEEPPPSE
ncbi:conserved hypothetical protein, partial [Ixodes scapularis]